MPQPDPLATAIPRTHLLSNGRYSVMLTAAGSGYSQWLGYALTRLREDVTCDSWGSYMYLRDVGSGRVWSAGHQPVAARADEYTVEFSEGRAAFSRRDGGITTTTEVAVAADADGEVRRVTISNHGERECQLEVTTYAELVLAPAAADASHPAFSKLFVQTEYIESQQLVLATRRRRDAGEQLIWTAHWLDVENEARPDGGGVPSPTQALELTTDRASFLGRGHTLRNPAAVNHGGALDGATGTVLDPVVSLRRRLRMAPGASSTLQWWTVVAASRDDVLALVQRLRSLPDCTGTAAAAAAQAQAALNRLEIDAGDAERFQRLATALLYSDPALRAASSEIALGIGGAPTLWAGGISGDQPVVLVRVCSQAGLPLVDTVLKAKAFWADKRLAVDVVLLNEATADGVAALQTALEARIDAWVRQHSTAGAKPSLFALQKDRIPPELHAGLLTVARIVLDERRGALAGQLEQTCSADSTPSNVKGVLDAAASGGSVPASDGSSANQGCGPAGDSVGIDADAIEAQLENFNGYGGFDRDGREFVTVIRDGRVPPMPWSNVMANAKFGCTVTDAGGGYAWAVNSQKNAVTPWVNDPVGDPPQDVLYVRDLDDSVVWTATALPGGDRAGTYVVRHGQGYSRFQRHAHGIELDLLQYVPVADGIRISRLWLRNRSDRTRRLSVTAFVQWALGANGSQQAPFIVTSLDAATGALFARNAWRPDFSQRTAFIDLRGQQTSHTANRTEFLGRHGTLASPAALQHGGPLSGAVGAGVDPCGALQTQFDLAPDSEFEVVLLLGDAANEAAAQELVQQYRAVDLDQCFRAVRDQWDATLDTVQVRTPDRAMNVMLNRWLLYQLLSCRVWARTAYYQASGAYGFRDQLQDVMALCVTRPEVAREHLQRAAGRQFVEGDVQHWWLPPGGEGLRSRITDNRLWLPFVAAHYLRTTGDEALLATEQPFLTGEPLKPQQQDAFTKPSPTPETASLYEHCARAIDVSLALGAHGLPLFGTGDWNDGLNRVGAQGKGESVWLGWFLAATIDAFAPWAQSRGDVARANRWRECAASVRAALDAAGWDGEWYRRGYYDDGDPLGSSAASECQIDAIAQSWSVIAGGCDPARAMAAMDAVDSRLIRRGEQLALLFAPPFDKGESDPGYIKAYPPGIRENGGQYTHGAIWSIFALSKLGLGDRACELFGLINPIHHASSREAVERYKVEPYVVAADVYSVNPHVGRGGWTWYTGSAAWLYRAGLEAILGFHLEGNELRIDPCIPRDWPAFSIAYRRGSSRYLIEVTNPDGVSRGIARAKIDGVPLPAAPCRIPLHDDGGGHRVSIELGR